MSSCRDHTHGVLRTFEHRVTISGRCWSASKTVPSAQIAAAEVARFRSDPVGNVAGIILPRGADGEAFRPTECRAETILVEMQELLTTRDGLLRGVPIPDEEDLAAVEAHEMYEDVRWWAPQENVDFELRVPMRCEAPDGESLPDSYDDAFVTRFPSEFEALEAAHAALATRGMRVGVTHTIDQHGGRIGDTHTIMASVRGVRLDITRTLTLADVSTDAPRPHLVDRVLHRHGGTVS
jgi:hypothetical protein